jgi:acyl carrier protein
MDLIGGRLKKCFSAVFPHLTESDILRATPESVGAWDSVATVSLFALIYEEFGFTVDPEALEHISFEGIVANLRASVRQELPICMSDENWTP